MGYDHRIGFDYLRPGPGWGGSCLPKDTRALVYIAEQAGYDFSLLRGAIETNEEQFERVVAKISAAVGRRARGRDHRGVGPHLQGGHRRPARLACGRDRAAARGRGRHVRAFDPTVRSPAARSPPDRRLVERPPGRLAGLPGRAYPTPTRPARAPRPSVVLTEWDEFRWLDFAKVRDAWPSRSWSTPATSSTPRQLRRIGFEYAGHRAPVTGAPHGGRHGRRGVPRLASLRHAGGPRRRGRLRRRPLHRAPVERGPPGRPPGFELVVADVSRSLPVDGPVDAGAPPRQPGVAARLPGPAARDPGGGERRDPPRPRAGRGHGARFLLASTSEVYGDPERAPPDRDVLGQRQPGRAPQRLRRGQAVRRGAHHGLPPDHGTDVGIVRIFNTYGPRLRPGDGRVVSNFLVQAIAGRAPHRLRRREPDPEPVLRRRRGARAPGPARLGPHRTGQHRQSRRAHRARAGPDRGRAARVVLADRAPAAAGRRSHPPAPGHHPGPGELGLGADHRPLEEGLRPDRRLSRRPGRGDARRTAGSDPRRAAAAMLEGDRTGSSGPQRRAARPMAVEETDPTAGAELAERTPTSTACCR